MLDLLLKSEIINKEEYNDAFEESKITGVNTFKILSKSHNISEKDFYRQLNNLLELNYGVPAIRLSDFTPDEKLINYFGKELITKYKFIPLKRDGMVYRFAMVNPDDFIAEREIKLVLNKFKNYKLFKRVLPEEELNSFLENYYQEAKSAQKFENENADEIISSLDIDFAKSVDFNEDTADLTDSAHEAPIVKLANNILGTAILRGVSDIHIEPREKELVVRYRLDGVLQVYKKFPVKIKNAVVSRFKIMAELDISERRLPQDGRIRVKLSDKYIDFRMSTLPGKFGEKVVLRILDKSNISFGLDNLISDTDTLIKVRDMINIPYGIIYVTGPTGSGKTTTLYSALKEKNDPEVNISTIEDPIEYDLDGITQTAVNKTIGLDFAKALRAFLRQDPDIILVGETRDKETAKIAVEAALTGHLVFTTLHTNDSASSVMRLTEMGIEPYLVASSTIGIIAQRLLRKVCNECKEPYTPDKNILEFLKIPQSENITFYHARGCEKCNHTGYKGRIGTYEVLKFDDKIRELVSANSNAQEIRNYARENGMMTLLDYSIQLALQGYTTIDEVMRVTFSDTGQSGLCPNCAKTIKDEFNICPSCGYNLKKKCSKCSAPLKSEWIYCSNCGENVTSSTS
ncbi:MAG: ATPase, T2SS/T4P/T4SS family [Candidatus Gastranaerophilaceae bacterium]|jgi:type IV pilus assembly protein PilB